MLVAFLKIVKLASVVINKNPVSVQDYWLAMAFRKERIKASCCFNFLKII